MKIACNQNELSRVLSIVSRATGGGHSSLPILDNILISIDEDKTGITCIATNLEIAITARVSAEIALIQDGPSQALLPGKQLTDVVRSLPAGKVEIVTSKTGATVKCGKSNFKLPVTPVAEFPNIAAPSGGSFTISNELFLQAVKQTVFAANPKDPRPYQCSVLFDIEPGKLIIVATDSNRLAISEIPVDGSNLNQQIMVPVNSLKKITDAISEDNIQFYIKENQLFAVSEDVVVSAQLIQGQYPRYQQIIPNDFAGQMKIRRVEFIRILERAELVDFQARLQIVTERENKSFSVSNGKEGSQFQEEIELAKQSGSLDFNDGFNVKFILDFLKTLDSDTVELNYIGGRKPVLLKCGDDGTCRYLLMPLILPQTQNPAA